MVPFSSFQAYPEPSNRRLKPEKTIREVSAGFWRRKIPRDSFLCLHTTISRLRMGLETRNWYHQNRLGMGFLNMSLKIFQHVCERNGNAKRPGDTISSSLGGGRQAAMLLVSQRDVDKYGSQPVGITLYFYVVGFRVKNDERNQNVVPSTYVEICTEF